MKWSETNSLGLAKAATAAEKNLYCPYFLRGSVLGLWDGVDDSPQELFHKNRPVTARLHI